MPDTASPVTTRPSKKRKAATVNENLSNKKVTILSPNTSALRRRNFFRSSITLVKRPALFDITSSPSRINTLPSRVPNQLLTPESSPSYVVKKQKTKTVVSENILIHEDEAKTQIECEDEEESEPEIVTCPPIRKKPVDLRYRLLQRSFEGFEGGQRGHHYGEWKDEVSGFYSKADDVHQVFSDENVHVMPFSTAAFHRHPIIAIGDESGCVRLVSTHQDSESSAFKGYKGFSSSLLEMPCHENAVFDLSITEDDRKLATASGDQTVRVFDVEKQACLALLAYHEASVKQVAFNPLNPSILVSSSRDSDVHLWDLRVTGTQSPDQAGLTVFKPVKSIYKAHHCESSGKNMSVTAAKWLPSSEYKIATACESNATVKVWDIRQLQYRRKASPQPVDKTGLPQQHNFNPHRNYGITSMNISSDGTRLYALCKDSFLYAYSVPHMSSGPIHAYSHPKLRTATFYVKSSLSKDDRFLATGSSDGSVIVFPTEERYLDKDLYGRSSICQQDDPSTPSSSQPNAGKELQLGQGAALIRGHEKEVTGVVWSQRGEVVSISDDFTARCWRDGYYGSEAEELRSGGENEGKRWGCGWAEV